MPNLEAQYRAMDYEALDNLKRNAVLSQEAMAMLFKVMAEKERDHFSGAVSGKLASAKASRDFSRLTEPETEHLLARIVLTTESNPIDLRVSERLDIVTAECVYGVNVFRDLSRLVTDVVGGRSHSAQGVLRDARKECLRELKLEALRLGADAVIGVRLNYNELSGGGKSQMLMVVAVGTAVTLKASP